MQNAQQDPPFDAFQTVADSLAEVPQWYALLKDSKNHRGLAEILVQSWRGGGAGGYRTEATSVQARPDASDGEIRSTDTVSLTDETIAVLVTSAWQVAQRVARRDGISRFRMQLMHARGKDHKRVAGEYATIWVDPITLKLSHDVSDGGAQNKDPEKGLVKLLTSYVDTLLGRMVEITANASQMTANAIELGDRLEERRHAIEDRASELATESAPEERTKQVVAGLQFAGSQMQLLFMLYLLTKDPQSARTFADAMRFMGGNNPSGSHSANQDEVQAWWAGVPEGMQLQLREEIGEETYAAFVTGIFAEPHEWPACVQGLQGMCAQLAPRFLHVLGEQRFRSLCSLLGARLG